MKLGLCLIEIDHELKTCHYWLLELKEEENGEEEEEELVLAQGASLVLIKQRVLMVQIGKLRLTHDQCEQERSWGWVSIRLENRGVFVRVLARSAIAKARFWTMLELIRAGGSSIEGGRCFGVLRTVESERGAGERAGRGPGLAGGGARCKGRRRCLGGEEGGQAGVWLELCSSWNEKKRGRGCWLGAGVIVWGWAL